MSILSSMTEQLKPLSHLINCHFLRCALRAVMVLIGWGSLSWHQIMNKICSFPYDCCKIFDKFIKGH